MPVQDVQALRDIKVEIVRSMHVIILYLPLTPKAQPKHLQVDQENISEYNSIEFKKVGLIKFHQPVPFFSDFIKYISIWPLPELTVGRK